VPEIAQSFNAFKLSSNHPKKTKTKKTTVYAAIDGNETLEISSSASRSPSDLSVGKIRDVVEKWNTI
jgi:hypothetical protein